MTQITMTDTPPKKTIRQKYTDIMPHGAGALFFIQIFSTIAFSILYSTLVLYATKGLHLDDKTATAITTSFVAFNYTLHLIGGLIGGRFLSYRVLFVTGMILQIVGCSLLSIPDFNMLLWGLAAFLTGAGSNVTCINCILTQLFKPEDKRRESAFLWNYSGMNIGFFVGFSVSGWLQLENSYHILFMFAAIGNIFSLLLIFFHWRKLKDSNTYLSKAKIKNKIRAYLIGSILISFSIIILHLLLQYSSISNELIMFTGISMLGLIAFLSIKQPAKVKRNKMHGYLILAVASTIFFTLYQMAPMGLILFIERNVNRHYLGILIAPQWVQNINTIIIIIGGPLLSSIFTSLRNRGFNLNIPLQFGIALLLIGVAFILLPVGISFSDSAGFTNFNWIILTYILQSTGELFISPIGYAMIGELAPENLQGIMMGTWMMLVGVAATMSGYFSNLALNGIDATNPLITNPGYSHTFKLLGISSIVAGFAMLLLIPVILRLINASSEK